MNIKTNGAVSLTLILAVGNAFADCERGEVQWLQSKGYTPREAMAWCTSSPSQTIGR